MKLLPTISVVWLVGLRDEVHWWICLDIATHRSPLWWKGGRVRGAVISPWKLSEKRMLVDWGQDGLTACLCLTEDGDDDFSM